MRVSPEQHFCYGMHRRFEGGSQVPTLLLFRVHFFFSFSIRFALPKVLYVRNEVACSRVTWGSDAGQADTPLGTFSWRAHSPAPLFQLSDLPPGLLPILLVPGRLYEL